MSSSAQAPLVHVVAENVRRLRKIAHLTQTELADAAGISRASVAQIEGQRYNSFTLATLEGIAKALSTAPIALLEQRDHTLSPLTESFQLSPWTGVLLPTEAELARLTAVLQAMDCAAETPLALIAELLQVMRRIAEKT